MNIQNMTGQQLIDYVAGIEERLTVQQLKDIVAQASAKVEGKSANVTNLLYNGQMKDGTWTVEK